MDYSSRKHSASEKIVSGVFHFTKSDSLKCHPADWVVHYLFDVNIYSLKIIKGWRKWKNKNHIAKWLHAVSREQSKNDLCSLAFFTDVFWSGAFLYTQVKQSDDNDRIAAETSELFNLLENIWLKYTGHQKVHVSSNYLTFGTWEGLSSGMLYSQEN